MSISVTQLNERSLEIFRTLVDAYMETGEPIGSRTLSRRLGISLSPATIRNVMADLEDAGLLYAPHTSAGRLPTDEGLKYFVQGLLEVGQLTPQDQESIESLCMKSGKNLNASLEEATKLLSGLSQCAGVVVAPKSENTLKHIEFVPINQHSGLVILITDDGMIENRIIDLPPGLPSSSLVESTNYLNSFLSGKTLREIKDIIHNDLTTQRAHLHELSNKVIQTGLAVWADDSNEGALIVKGQAHLLNNITELKDIDRIRELFETLETQKSMIDLLDASINAQGIQIFIGSKNPLFNMSGCSVIVSPFKNTKDKVIGAIGIIGPTRMNYGKIIPLVDYTAKILSRIIG